MTPTEILPLLVAVLLVLSASGVQPDAMTVTFGGDRTVTAVEDVLVVGGGTVTVPADTGVTGRLFVLGGDLRIDGSVDGAVWLFGGNLTVTDGATITGELRTIAGDAAVASGARIGRRTALPGVPRPQSPLEAALSLLAQALAVGLFGGLVTRRWPGLVATVGDAMTGHAAVSGVVGGLAGLTSLVLLVYMAFTLVLLPLSVLGLAGAFLTVVYSYVAFGALLGRYLPVDRPALAAGAGTAVFVVAVDLVGRIPLLGVLVQFGLAAVGFGAVLLTYFGLQRFEPPEIPGGAR
ncbi:MAG: polymer-forming cytoskeletal protein [Haloarculaceae archaeon]